MDVADFFSTNVAADVRNQVEYVASDQPSPALATAFRYVLPALMGVYLDSIHFGIIYHTGALAQDYHTALLAQNWHKPRSVQSKFNCVDYTMPAETWGAIQSCR